MGLCVAWITDYVLGLLRLEMNLYYFDVLLCGINNH
jgi:hypothetical protein